MRVVPCQDKQAMLRWLCDRWRHLMICTVMFDRVVLLSTCNTVCCSEAACSHCSERSQHSDRPPAAWQPNILYKEIQD